MSIKNRNEIATQVTTKIVPEVDNATHIDLLNNNVVNSMLTRKDVINAAFPVGGALIVDYSEGNNTDLATVTLTQSTAVTFAGLENGDVKYLKITKTAGYAVTFANASNESDSQEYIDTLLTSILYAVYQKNGVNHVKSITKSLFEATLAEVLNGTANKYITPKILQSIPWSKVGDDGGLTTLESYIDPTSEIYYRFNIFGDFEIWVKYVLASAVTSANVVTLNNVITLIGENTYLGNGLLTTLTPSEESAFFSLNKVVSLFNLRCSNFNGLGAGTQLQSGVLTLPKNQFIKV